MRIIAFIIGVILGYALTASLFSIKPTPFYKNPDVIRQVPIIT